MTARSDRQSRVDIHFDSEVSYWHEVYEAEALDGVLYRERKAAVLAWVDSLALPRPAHALDAGSGAGFMSIALAQRGYAVDAVDASTGMVALTSRHVEEEGLADKVTARVADVHALPFDTGSHALVVALGVIPWIEAPARAVAELARVLAPGGHLILTADNRARLNAILDLRASPYLARLRQAKHALRRRGRPPSGTLFRFHWPSTVDAMVADAGLDTMARRTTGFGPFSLMGRRMLDQDAGIRAHRRLQDWADAGVPGLRGTGAHYLVHASKPGAP
jgi:SAM-dependent methyltransferase